MHGGFTIILKWPLKQMNKRQYMITTDKLNIEGKMTDVWVVTSTSIEMPGMTFDLGTFFSLGEAEQFLKGQELADKYKNKQ